MEGKPAGIKVWHGFSAQPRGKTACNVNEPSVRGKRRAEEKGEKGCVNEPSEYV